MLTVADVAKRLNLSMGMVYKIIATGTLGSYRFGSAIRISEEQITEYRKRSENGGVRIATGFKHLRKIGG